MDKEKAGPALGVAQGSKVGANGRSHIGLLLALLFHLASSSALAHPGRTNASGCHNNRKTGGYHCHNTGKKSAPSIESFTAKTDSRTSAISGVVKMSVIDICHAPGTTYYSRLMHYTPYKSVEACLNAGGRLPKR